MPEKFNSETSDQQLLKCLNCGAELRFHPDSKLLICDNCGTERSIEFNKSNLKSESFILTIEQFNKEAEREIVEIINCNACGAEVFFENYTAAGYCSFCSSHLDISDKKNAQRIKPVGILPFEIKQSSAIEKFKVWSKSQWLAPNDFFHISNKTKKLVGMYIPYWQFEADTFSYFVGEVNDSDSDGNDTSYKVDGKLSYRFEKLLICGSSSLPIKQINELEPWYLDRLVDYDKQYIKGFNAEVYSQDLGKAFENSKAFIEDELIEYLQAVRRKNNQPSMTVMRLETDFRNVKFKHILLPIWVSSYPYQSKIYRFVINGQTGEVQGERPYSKPKTLFFIIGWLIALSGLISSVIFLDFTWAIIGASLSILLFNLLYYIAKNAFDLKGKRGRVLRTRSVK